jgi:hypothetical protein
MEMSYAMTPCCVLNTVAILAMTLASPAIADTIYITPNLPGGSVQDATQPGYAIQELGGIITIYRTMPGSANLRDVTAPSYTIRRNDFDMSDPAGLNQMKRDMGLDPDD